MFRYRRYITEYSTIIARTSVPDPLVRGTDPEYKELKYGFLAVCCRNSSRLIASHVRQSAQTEHGSNSKGTIINSLVS
jgi:hypothetical protein